ncbi:hypothetical protein AMAG_13051, partial [Allomyces macrogynus ATCC 38327]
MLARAALLCLVALRTLNSRRLMHFTDVECLMDGLFESVQLVDMRGCMVDNVLSLLDVPVGRHGWTVRTGSGVRKGTEWRIKRVNAATDESGQRVVHQRVTSKRMEPL